MSDPIIRAFEDEWEEAFPDVEPPSLYKCHVYGTETLIRRQQKAQKEAQAARERAAEKANDAAFSRSLTRAR